MKQKCKSRNKNKWWTSDCSAARKRSRLFFHIWKSAGRPSQGIVFQCYKEERKSYKKACRRAVQKVVNNKFKILSKLYTRKCPRKFWNAIRKLKQTKSEHDAISLKDFEKYFTDKFKSCSVEESGYLRRPRELVQEKYDEIQGKPKDYTTSMSVFKMRKYVKQLRNGCAPGVDSS